MLNYHFCSSWFVHLELFDHATTYIAILGFLLKFQPPRLVVCKTIILLVLKRSFAIFEAHFAIRYIQCKVMVGLYLVGAGKKTLYIYKMLFLGGPSTQSLEAQLVCQRSYKIENKKCNVDKFEKYHDEPLFTLHHCWKKLNFWP